MKSSSQASHPTGVAVAVAPTLFAVAALVSAALVFLVEPIMARMVLPVLGGASAVWAVSLAFFQVALLVGYAYAHGLQKIASVRLQTLVHGAVLLAGLAVLPLRLTGLLGEPGATAPSLWLLGVLTLSIGLPFAALCATAPLVQAWYASTRGAGGGGNPYGLFVASNLGSLLALLAYPSLVEPMVRLRTQALGWSLAYGGFILLLLLVAVPVWRAPAGPVQALMVKPPATRLAALARWWRRFLWLVLAAAPASLMIGVTSYIATDIAAAPLVWAAPLALYLLSLIIAFQPRPAVSPHLALVLQSAALLGALASLALPIPILGLQIGLQLTSFFLTALVCHQALVIRRPPPERLTEFYLLVAAGGALGGCFSALVAPLLFRSVAEFPLVMLAAGLARPWGRGWLSPAQTVIWLVGAGAIAAALAYHHVMGGGPILIGLFGLTLVCAFILRDRAMAFVLLAVALVLGTQAVRPDRKLLRTERSFYGVVRISQVSAKGLGEVRLMAHGAALHGAQAQEPAVRCRPLIYYAPTTPIGQVFRLLQAEHETLNVGVVGMGAGAVAAYSRPGDSLRFFELDPMVVRLATDPAVFSYIHGCAKGSVDWVVGDGRLGLTRQPEGRLDLLVVDAFSSDALPTHLLTVEALRTYLSRVRPDGLVVLHLSNQSLELTAPVAAAAKAAGAVALRQFYRPAPDGLDLNDSAEDVVILSRDPKAITAFALDPRWRPADPGRVAAWTDDYTDLFGALIRGYGHNQRETALAASEAEAAARPKPSPAD